MPPPLLILRDGPGGPWLRYSDPVEVLCARTVAEVGPALARLEHAVEMEGLHAAGFLSYEAAPAFDPAFRVRAAENEFPLLWFGLFREPVPWFPSVSPNSLSNSSFPLPTSPFQLPTSHSPLLTSPIPSISQDEYLAAVGHVKEHIAAGDTYQVNLSFRLRGQAPCDLFAAFEAMAAVESPPWGAYVDTGEWILVSASPELFFQLDRNRIVSRPMKGTRPRGADQAADIAARDDLAGAAKDRAENVMITDMVRNDLGRIARPGSVKVESLCDLEAYPTVWQMTSTVAAETDASPGGILRALFPPASITGAPKIITTRLIAELETTPRGIYTGCLGAFAPGRQARLNVAIRTLCVHRPTGQAEYGVGAGIVWDSDPEREWEECLVKARVVTESPSHLPFT